jgi:hypothetical protein
MSRVLFILKRREDFNAVVHSHIGMSTGLYNSAKFMNDMLTDHGVKSHLEVVEDYNRIDKFVTLHRPTHVIIEAIWVIPQKFAVLQKLHPTVTWVIRVHSETPFLAGEGMAFDWLADYSAFRNIVLAINAPRMMEDIKIFLQHKNNWTDEQTRKKVIYLPNYYPQTYTSKLLNTNKDTIDISCFGAIRPLKNHILQAIASIGFADQIGKKLRFHVNAGRIEMQGGPVIKNLKSIFQQIHGRGHELVNHLWRPREEFLELCAKMDIGLQCNLSETFNIVGADLISQGVPLIGNADEIPWAVKEFSADPNSSRDIIEKLHLAYKFPKLNAETHQHALSHYTDNTAKIWTKYFLKG